MVGKLERSRVCNGNGDHDDWHRHAHDHSQQSPRALIDENDAHRFKHGNEVTGEWGPGFDEDESAPCQRETWPSSRKDCDTSAENSNPKSSKGKERTTASTIGYPIQPKQHQPNGANTASVMTAAQCAATFFLPIVT